MNYFERLLLVTAFVFKLLNPPHFIKFTLFLLLKNRQIKIRSLVKISNAKIDLNLGDFIDYWIFMDGLYEGKWLMKITEFVKGRTFFDIGANIGIYTLALSKIAKYIYAFEPERTNYKRLVRNLNINSIANAKAIRKALSNQNSNNLPLYIHKNNKGLHSTVIPLSNKTQIIKAVTLDHFVKVNKIKDIGLIKIDTEGGELNVLTGAQKTIRELHPPLLIELNRPLSKIAGYELIDLYRLLMKNNYKSYKLKGKLLVRIRNSYIPNIYYENLLFI